MMFWKKKHSNYDVYMHSLEGSDISMGFTFISETIKFFQWGGLSYKGHEVCEFPIVEGGFPKNIRDCVWKIDLSDEMKMKILSIVTSSKSLKDIHMAPNFDVMFDLVDRYREYMNVSDVELFLGSHFDVYQADKMEEVK